jgi:hypothetical protein
VANRHGEDRGGSKKLDTAHHLLPGQLTAVARIIFLNIAFSFGRTGLPVRCARGGRHTCRDLDNSGQEFDKIIRGTRVHAHVP